MGRYAGVDWAADKHDVDLPGFDGESLVVE
jgi:hypothetical protein